MASAYEPSEELRGLVSDAIEHACESISEGGPLIPFVIVEKRGKRSVQRFMSGYQEADGGEESFDMKASTDEAIAAAAASKGKADRVVAATDGLITLKGLGRTDCLFVHAFETGAPVRLCIAAPYRSAEEEGEMELVQQPFCMQQDKPWW